MKTTQTDKYITRVKAGEKVAFKTDTMYLKVFKALKQEGLDPKGTYDADGGLVKGARDFKVVRYISL